jgi:hypothetical protein
LFVAVTQNEMTLVSAPSAPESVETAARLHRRGLTDAYEHHRGGLAAADRADRAALCELAARLLGQEEAAGRAALAEEFMFVFEKERGMRHAAADRAARKGMNVRSRGMACDARHARLAATYDAAAAAREERFADVGKAELHTQHQRELVQDANRAERLAKIRDAMNAIDAVIVHIVSEHGRQRRAMEKDEVKALRALGLLFKRETAEATLRVAETAHSALLERSKKVDAALAAERQSADKASGQQRRQQARLVGRCTHSRLGKSVFAGSFAKKMCLICKVKLDAATGLYVQM